MIATKNNDSIFLNILFNGVKNHSFPVNLNGKSFEDFKEGEIIYESGDESNFVYLVISGKVKIKENGIKKLQFRRDNEFFCVLEIIKNTQRTSSAMAEIDSIVYKISKPDFESLLKKVPAIKQNIIDFTNLTEDDFKENNEVVETPSMAKEEFSETAANENNNDQMLNETTEQKNEDKLPDYLKDLDEFEEIVHDDEIREAAVQHEQTDAFVEPDAPVEESFNELVVNDTFIESDFVYESQPEPETNSESIAEDSSGQEAEIDDKIIPIEDELESILEDKISLKNFNMILNQISANQNIDLTVQSILKNFLQLTGSDRGIIFIYDEKKAELIPEFNIGGKPEIPSIKISEGIAGKAALSKKLIFIPNPESDARYVGSFDNPFEFPAQNVIYLPLLDNQLDLQGFATLSFNGETLEDNFRRQLKIYSI
ncbi:MAG: cyclic nucleotide-binding domain-containing protein, partial [Ignavibacterium sp.]|nr:cyclic nucleotide-binding domain-containing protein [Ignavibacterium sp.]